MKSKTIIRLVSCVCYFIYYAFVKQDRGLATMYLKDIETLKDE